MSIGDSILRSVITLAARDDDFHGDEYGIGLYRGMIIAAGHDEHVSRELVVEAGRAVDALRVRARNQAMVAA